MQEEGRREVVIMQVLPSQACLFTVPLHSASPQCLSTVPLHSASPQCLFTVPLHSASSQPGGHQLLGCGHHVIRLPANSRRLPAHDPFHECHPRFG